MESSPHQSTTVLKRPYFATWCSAIITAITFLTSSNFFSIQSDACVHPRILIIHVADQDFTQEIVIQNSNFRIASQNLKLRTLPTHSASLVFSSKSLGFIGILFKVIRIHWNSLSTHSASLVFSSKSFGLTGILFQVTWFHWNSLQSHPNSLEFSVNALGFTGILFQHTRLQLKTSSKRLIGPFVL